MKKTVLIITAALMINQQSIAQSLEGKIHETNLPPIPFVQSVNEKGYKIPDTRGYIWKGTQWIDTDKDNFTDIIGEVFWDEKKGFIIEYMSMKGIVFAYTVMQSDKDAKAYTILSSRCNKVFDLMFLLKEPPYVPECAK